ncbi:MAG: penicillin-binding protein, partial [Archangium sp.]|nr:penicillin-binding protein [Archangium sp.]
MRDLKAMQPMEAPTKWMRLRVYVIGVVFFALLIGALTRAWNLQVHQTERLKAYAEDQYVRAMEIPARRGEIVDRRGTRLASSVDVDSVWVDPSMLPDQRDAARKLGKALGVDAKDLTQKFENARRFAWVKRQVTDSEAAKVKALQLPGIGFAREPKRFYPQRELAAHLIGVVGTDGHGLEGLESSFEDELSGERIKREGFRDAKGRKLLTNGVEDPLTSSGASVTLTIDSTVQYVT